MTGRGSADTLTLTNNRVVDIVRSVSTSDGLSNGVFGFDSAVVALGRPQEIFFARRPRRRDTAGIAGRP